MGALVNGVFLVALCMSIFLEAIQRFVEVPTVSNPKLVLIVGCCGLASNVLGLLLFHDHNHSKGSDERVTMANETRQRHSSITTADIEGNTTTTSEQDSATTARQLRHDFARVGGSGLGNPDFTLVHPATFRGQIIAAANTSSNDTGTSGVQDSQIHENDLSSEHAPLLPKNSVSQTQNNGIVSSPVNASHATHNHARAKSGRKTQGHEDMNTRGVFLHVVGDALGNLGVIASALIIWLSNFSWRYYADPAISLVITIVILASAIPLCRAASRVLLQAVPADLSIDHVREDLEQLHGVLSCHDLHIWQLSDSQTVASVHIKVKAGISSTESRESEESYMHIAEQIEKCIHEYGVTSCTIQPEFVLGPDNPT